MVNSRPTNYRLKPGNFFKFQKFHKITLLWSLFTQDQTLTCSLQNSSSKQVFLENYQEDPEKVFKKHSGMGVLLGSFQKFSEQLFYWSTKGRLLPKIQAAKKSRTQTNASGWISRELRSNYNEKWVIVTMWYWYRITKHKKESSKINFNNSFEGQKWNPRLTKTFLVYIKN